MVRRSVGPCSVHFRRMLAGGCSLLALTCSAPRVLAQAGATTTWTDGTGSWFSDGNWSNGKPGSATDATVDNGGTAQVNSGPDGAKAVANLLTIGSASGVQITGGSISRRRGN